MIKSVIALILALSMIGPGYKTSYSPEKFVLPEEAAVLVVVEGREDKTCTVTAFEKNKDRWEPVFAVNGNTGRSGMSRNRKEGDGTTPVGVWMLNTPFGQKPAEEGFPEDYIKVDSSYVWTEDTNRLTVDPENKLKGERVGSSEYARVYDYVLDAGYNRNAVNKKGSALFIHCQGATEAPSSGCIKIPKEEMIQLMKLYGKYGAGKCFIAQGIDGEIDKLYDKYGTNNGLEAVY